VVMLLTCNHPNHLNNWLFCFVFWIVNEFPVLKADGIKYIMIFRNQVSSFLFAIQHLQILLRTSFSCSLCDRIWHLYLTVSKNSSWFQIKLNFPHIFSCGTGNWSQGLTLARQALCFLHTTSQDLVLKNWDQCPLISYGCYVLSLLIHNRDLPSSLTLVCQTIVIYFQLGLIISSSTYLVMCW
jgi:hypothetical protein